MKLFSCLLAVLVLGIFSPGIAKSEDAATLIQRNDFLRAEQALYDGKRLLFERLTRTLVDYPLYPYLRYKSLRRSLAAATPIEVNNFLEEFKHTLLAPRLRNAWLRRLARQKRWNTFIEFYRPGDNVPLQCYYRRALYKSGQRDAALTGIENLWLVGKSQPRPCDPIFRAWRTTGGISADLVWQRFQLAINAGNIKLARYLERLLPARDKRWARLWRWVHRQPRLILSEQRFAGNHPQRNHILLHGMKRFSRLQPDQAVNVWQQLNERYNFSAEEHWYIEREIGLNLASKGRPEALAWLASIDPAYATRDVREWRIRSALSQHNWTAALVWINQLDVEARNARQWRYWSARAMEQTGQMEKARQIYFDLAQLRSYYGFLAADRLQLPYRIEGMIPPSYDVRDLGQVERIPAILRARELFKLHRLTDARREWYSAIRKLDDGQIGQAAKLAHRWGWHEQAILTAAKSSQKEDIELRFPLAHRTRVIEQADANNVDPALAFAVIRQESAFNPHARSHHGALGLMQIMPDTARWIARTFDFSMRRMSDLYDADTNIRFGVTYLREMLDNFDDHPVLATAAYNAGGGRIRRYLPVSGTIPADLWIETLPIAETRNYLKHVQAYTTIYRHRLGQSGVSLVQHMPPIQAPAAKLSVRSAPRTTAVVVIAQDDS